MKIRSLSNNRKAIGAGMCAAVAAVVLLLCIMLGKARPDSAISYHLSRWNEFAPLIVQEKARQENIEPARIGHIYGGVVSHHIPTALPNLVEFYERLKRTQNVKRFIIIGPDHTDAGIAPITVSNEDFFTEFGQAKPIGGLAPQLEAAQVAHIEESIFDPEHSIGSQILVISSIFPGAEITPIILRSNVSEAQAGALGKKLAEYLDEETVLIASVDFSHYLPTAQALPMDAISGEVVRSLDSRSLSLIKADSSKSMLAFMRAMSEKNASTTANFSVLNTNDLMQNSDYTTGYVFGYWGRY